MGPAAWILDLQVHQLLDESRQPPWGGLHLVPHGGAIDTFQDDAGATLDLDDAIGGGCGQPGLVDGPRDVRLEPAQCRGDVRPQHLDDGRRRPAPDVGRVAAGDEVVGVAGDPPSLAVSPIAGSPGGPARGHREEARATRRVSAGRVTLAASGVCQRTGRSSASLARGLLVESQVGRAGAPRREADSQSGPRGRAAVGSGLCRELGWPRSEADELPGVVLSPGADGERIASPAHPDGDDIAAPLGARAGRTSRRPRA